MTESAQKVLDLLRERRLLPDALIDSLHKQVAAAPQPLEAQHIVKLLVQKGKLTAFQASELLAVAESQQGATAKSPAIKAAKSSIGKTPEKTTPAAASSATDAHGLGLAHDEEDTPKTQRHVPKTLTTTATKSAATEPKKQTPASLPSPVAPAPSLGGGIDDLLNDPALNSASLDPLGIAQPKQKSSWLGSIGGGGKGKKKKSGGRWESPLIIVGGGALLLLLIMGVVLTFNLLRRSADEILKTAEQEYSNGAYAAAIEKYETFLRGRAKHPQASLARVRIGLARLRMASAGDPNAALAQAESILPTLESEPALEEVRPELANLLPDIAEKFAAAAGSAADTSAAAKQVEQFRAAMRLVNNSTYLPMSVKSPLLPHLEQMQQQIDAAVRQIEQTDRLRVAIAAIEAATAKKDSAAAYKVQRELLQAYPRLSGNDDLRAAVVAVSASLRDQVRTAAAKFSPETEDHPSAATAEIALAKTSGRPIAALAGQVVPVVIDGALHVLAADDGRLLWRRWVGRDVESARLVGDAAAAGVLTADSQRQELLRLQGSDGKLQWRLPIGEPFLVGTEQGGKVLVTLPSGKMLAVDLASGKVQQQVEFPQRLAASAAASTSGDVVFQCGDHSNLYVLDGQSLACPAVHYLGHKNSTIDLPPQIVGPVLVVPQQAGMRRSLLHVLQWHEQDSTVRAVQQPLAIDEQLALPLLADASRAAVVDRAGAIRIVEAQDAGDVVSLKIVAEKSGAREDATPYAVVASGLLVMGDRRLAGYRIRAARGTLPATWATHEGDRFVAPLQVAGDYVFHVRRPSGKSGVVVSAASLAPPVAQDAGQPIWQTQLALEPETAATAASDGAIAVRSAEGDVFKIPARARGSRALNAAAAATSPPNQAEAKVRKTGASWHGGTLVFNDLGQIEFVAGVDQPQTPKLFPFQPPQRPDQRTQWLAAAAIDDEQFVAADRAGGVFVIAISEAGAPHLSAVRQMQTSGPLVAGPVVMEEHVLVVQRGEKGDVVLPLALADLKAGSPLALAGRVVWGPQVVGEKALLASEPGGVIAIDETAQQAWACDLQGETLIGQPVAAGELLWLATSSGRLRRVARETGEVLQTIEFGEPLGPGAAVFGSAVVVRTADGAVLIAETPR